VDRRVSRSRRHLAKGAIRPAQTADVDALLAIENAAFASDRIERRAFGHAIRSPTMICLVVSTDAEVVGYGIVERRRGSTAARLTSIAVAPKAAGAGLGQRLLAALEHTAREAGPSRMRLEVHAENRRARKLYETAGYRVVERLDNYYEDGSAALRYEKTLAP
jgi:ribosomal protein S18 acetylase RimI-like enzyme